MPLSRGSRLGPYEVLSALGSGGMGEVYRARDTRLDRTVAIKVLPEAISRHPEVLERFEREARAISSLSHPNICALYDIGEENGVRFLVMEYLEGETLADRLRHGPLPLDRFWPIVIQIGTALDQAHRHGIVHRDLKPANVMLTGSKSSPAAKLLDFGLAKMAGQKAGTTAGSASQMATAADTLTAAGTILGTFQYMAPEQLAGQEADVRTDIFAFGTVLYECATGRKAFDSPTQAHLISAIMTSEPPPVSPPALDRVIRRCMAKEPDDRWQSAADLTAELRWVSEGGTQTAPVIAHRRNLSKLGWLVAAALAIALAAWSWIPLREQSPVARPFRFSIVAPDKFNFVPTPPAISPDSSKLVFVASDGRRQMMFLRNLNTLDAEEIKGTEGGTSPFWSPDGKEIGFFAGGKLKKVNLSGGSPVALADGFCCGAWSQNGAILYVPGLYEDIQRISAEGGACSPVFHPDVNRQTGSHPVFLPDGRHFLFLAYSGTVLSLFAGSLDSAEVNKVMPAEGNFAYVAPGLLIFPRAGALLAQRFDTRRLKLTQAPVQVAEQVSTSQGNSRLVPAAAFARDR
jgi:eukaryotic-like serine/threonine-protein kinase